MKSTNLCNHLRIGTVAKCLSCTERYVYTLIQDGKIKAIKDGRRFTRVSEQSLIDYIESITVNPDDYYDPDRKEVEPEQEKVLRSKWMNR
ncbi:MAG: helix-turn-helix domain-containing protein [Syntrophales bacterium]|jgi:excisionase family DNA binding protein